MTTGLTSQEKQQIATNIRAKYGMVAPSPRQGSSAIPLAGGGLEALGYDPEILKTLPEPVAASYSGVGNPFTLGPIRKGEAVLDLGGGAACCPLGRVPNPGAT
jgi:arsenite methyltransferase